MKETSLMAFEEIKPKRPIQHNKILSALTSLGKGTTREISNLSQLTYHAVARRMSELRRDDKVCEDGTMLCPVSKRNVTIWKIKK